MLTFFEVLSSSSHILKTLIDKERKKVANTTSHKAIETLPQNYQPPVTRKAQNGIKKILENTGKYWTKTVNNLKFR